MSIIGSIRRFGRVSIESVAFEFGVIISARPEAMRLVLNAYTEGNELGVMRYFSDIARLVPGHSLAQNVEIRDMLIGSNHNMPDDAELNPSFIGEAYINLGYWGVYIIPITLALLLSWLYQRAVGKKGSLVWFLLYFSIIPTIMIGLSSGLGTRVPGIVISIFWIFVVSIVHNHRVYLKRLN